MVAFEAMMVASIHERKDVLETMRGRLLFDHPESLQSQYVFSTLDAAEYAKFLDADLDFDVLADSQASERRLEGIAAAYQKWKDAIFKDANALLKVAIIAQRHGDYRLATVCERELARKDGNASEVAAILFAREATNAAKLASLAEREKSDKYARLARQLLFVGLNEEERRDPAVLAIGLSDLTQGREWQRALDAADAALSLKADDPRIRYYRAWALCGLSRDAEALLAAKQLQNDAPNDPWAGALTPLIEGIESRQATLDSYLELKKHFQARASEVRGLEAWGVFPSKGHRIDAYIAGNLEAHRLEAVLKLDNNVVFAYRSTARDSALFSLGDTTIQAADVPGMIPIPKLKVGDSASNHFNLNYTIGVSNKDDDTLAAFRDAAEELEKLVVDRDKLEVVLVQSQQYGQLALPVKISDASILIRVASPCIDEPSVEPRVLKIVESDDGYRSNVELPDGIAFRFHFVTSSEHSYSPPAWPELPIQKQSDINAAALLRSAASLWQAFEKLGKEETPDANGAFEIPAIVD